MRIEQIQITNYKGFIDTGVVPIGSHITILIGKNNTGKTAFIEAIISSRLGPKPHLTGVADEIINPHGIVRLDISLSVRN